MIKHAIISCYDKSGLNEFAIKLVKMNPKIKIYSSSGTYKVLAGVIPNNVLGISNYTGFSEMPSGLVKTMHPKVLSGILADEHDIEQMNFLKSHGIELFDMVVVNLYPFEKAVAQDKGLEHARQNIDIGGVSLLEAALKNLKRVYSVCDPKDYPRIPVSLDDKKIRLELAKKTANYLKNYLEAINNYYQKITEAEL